MSSFSSCYCDLIYKNQITRKIVQKCSFCKVKDKEMKTIIYRSSYGLPLGRWISFMNKLWYYTADQNKLWAKLIYYPLDQLERQKINLERIHHSHFHKDKDDCYWCQEGI